MDGKWIRRLAALLLCLTMAAGAALAETADSKQKTTVTATETAEEAEAAAAAEVEAGAEDDEAAGDEEPAEDTETAGDEEAAEDTETTGDKEAAEDAEAGEESEKTEETAETEETEEAEDDAGLKLSESQVTVLKGKSVKLTATLSDASQKARFKWTTSDKKIAAVSQGKITGKKPGTATVTCTATLTDGSTLQAECDVTVAQPVTKVVPASKKASLIVGRTLQLTATVQPNNAADKGLAWESNKPEIAAVDENGMVTALKEGKATITVSATDGSRKKAKIQLTVKPLGILGDWVADASANTVLHFSEDGTMVMTIYSNNDNSTKVSESRFTYKTSGNKVTITSISMTVYTNGQASTLRSKYTSKGTVKGDTFTWKTLNQTQVYSRGSRPEPAENAETGEEEALEEALSGEDGTQDSAVTGTWSGSNVSLTLSKDGTGILKLSNGNRYSLTWTQEGDVLTMVQTSNPNGQPITGKISGRSMELQIGTLKIDLEKK